MLSRAAAEKVTLLDVSRLPYSERLCAAAVQGLLNREGYRVFLDYGIYDDPSARRTNEVFLDDEMWYGKYRAMLGNQDQRNLAYYREQHGFDVEQAESLTELLQEHPASFNGLVIWDESLPDSTNAALMLSGLEGLLPVTAELAKSPGVGALAVKHDLRGRWQDPLEVYTWALENLFHRCQPGAVACVEPGWQRPEFADYIVQNNLFTYSLSSHAAGLGTDLLMLLAFGPAWLRELLFALRLDGPLRRFAVGWMCSVSDEVNLATRIQRAVAARIYPTIFGWHTCRDDELAFMRLLSANGLRLVPAHMAGNYSFHAKVPVTGKPASRPRSHLQLDPEGVYLTFTLSDGDQLMMMGTGELGNWYSPARGTVPFNWEVQPLLSELAPALLEKFQRGATDMDCLVAGPSGAGYLIPPLTPDLTKYMKETVRICEQAGVDVVTSYVADPPRRVLKQLTRDKGSLKGFLNGYAVIKRAPQQVMEGTPVIANSFPKVEQIWYSAEDLLAAIQAEVDKPHKGPRFIATHLFAYRTSIDDIARFAAKQNDPHVHIVRGDDFLELFMESKRRKSDGS